MSAGRMIARSALLLALALALASPVVAQEPAGAGGNAAEDALVVAVQGVLDRLHQQGAVPAEPRLVVTPHGPVLAGEGAPSGGGGPGVGVPDALAERLDARVAALEEVRRCPAGPSGPCTLQEADAVVSLGPLHGTGARAAVDVLVTYAVPRIAHEPIRSAAYRIDLSRLGAGWTVTAMRPITPM